MSRRAVKLIRPVAAPRRFPAWVDAETRVIALPSGVEARVRDSLVLRVVAKGKGKAASGRRSSDVRRAS